MNAQPIDGAGSPRRWLLIFRRRTKHAWINRLVPGRYKHVCAIGYVQECDAWLFFDAWLGGTSIFVARGSPAKAMMLQWTRDADVLAMDQLRKSDEKISISLRMFCTGAVAHLVGVPGALLPSSLHRQCLSHGAKIVHGHAEPAADRPAADPSGTAGAARPGQRAAG